MRPLGESRALFVVGFLWTATLLVSCFGVKTYQNTPDNNLHVRTAVDSSSFFSSLRAAVEIHRVGADCTTDYEGTIQLNKPTIDIGIPPNRWSYLVFVFASSSFWANRSGTITYETLLKPRIGYHYQVMVSYKDDMYNVAVRETHPSGPGSREMERRELRPCPAT